MRQPTTRQRVASLAVAVSAIGGFAFATAGTAQSATPQNGTLESSEFGLYHNSGRGGCVHDLIYDDKTFSNNRFKGKSTCNGYGDTVNDATASYWNRSVLQYCVYTDADYEGAWGSLDPGYSGDASRTFRNKLSSAHWGKCG
ncbi:peptidase inhibitor family I36 protein [Streptomyces sp. A3M-1-3]|uniref:peptidase inhibitor family I36 protein n=1 Tax=Streptomyces sp. A3M-1-3 TaxID=2962044 RepID=UPI0020B77962|nr:peptidase inhibitor family I36 protein [Streptomyces sp. A3M-1-3]MCP3822399.1 peptidase inhibitor family I36 protein [Streptomyces sp. A3M-1-3]